MVKVEKRKIIKILFLLFFVVIFIISIYKIVEWKNNNDKNEEILDEIKDNVSVEIIDEKEKKYDINIDFKSLKEKNKDTVAWIKVNGTNIEFPIVQTTDNNYYLKHNFNKEYNTAGWIFADYRNKLDGTDKNIIIYGHNVRNGSMFSSLKNVLEREWYDNKENYIINFATENENQEYEVFSVYQIQDEGYYITTNFENNEFKEFVETVKNRSIKDFNVEVTEEDNILTLSTCANNNKYRIVLHAKKIIK